MELHIKSDKNPLKSADFRHGSSKERSEVLRSWWWIGHRRSQIWKLPKCQQVEASNPRGGAPFWIFEGKWEDQRASERVCALSLLLFWRASPILLAPSLRPITPTLCVVRSCKFHGSFHDQCLLFWTIKPAERWGSNGIYRYLLCYALQVSWSMFLL